MARALRVVLLVAVIGGAAWAVLRWPRLDTVETGRTAEYPALQPREYEASEAQVASAVRAAIDSLGWTFVGAGRGPGGSEVQASTRGTLIPLEHDVAVRAQRVGARTRVSVRAKSRNLAWDFGENARLIERFYAALDAGLRGR
jgi:hypothetical protein